MTSFVSGNKYALLIACSQYSSDLSSLSAPDGDIQSLSDVLQNKEIGEYHVKSIINEPSHLIKQEIESFFYDLKKNDTAVIYFSCHGVKDRLSRLYFACTNTKPTRLLSTSISSEFINDMMRNSACRTQILILDCCYSGAFAWEYTKADSKIDVGQYIKGQGKVVLTASDDMQYAYIQDSLKKIQNKYSGSIFTNAIIQGLKTGEADLNGDGVITIDELYEYAYRQVTDQKPEQTPTSWGPDKKGSIYFAKSCKININSHTDRFYKFESISQSISAKPNSTSTKSNSITNPASRNAKWYWERASKFAKLGLHEEALKMYEAITKLEPDDQKAWYEKGYSLGSLGKYEESLKAYEQAINLEPTHAIALYDKGLNLEKIGQKKLQK
jgi:tetratricopeptide (TPR) repeat protein